MGTLQVNSGPQISVGEITEADLRAARMGPSGNPTYEEQFGATSSPLGSVGVTPPSMAELELQAQQALARALDPNSFALGNQSHPQHEDFSETEKWKKLYGQSENEKGESRKREQQLEEAFNGLMTQYENLQANSSQRSWSNQMPPQNFGQNSPYRQPPENPFDGINDEEYLQGKQVKNLIEQHIAPPLAAAFQQSQDSAQRIAHLERALLNQVRESSGISKLDEFRLTSKNPWLNNLPEGQRLAAIQSLKQVETPQASQVQNPQVQAETQNRIMNKITYIEGSNPNVPDQTEAAIEAAKQRDYATVMQAPNDTGERARLFRSFALKYGINIGQNSSDLSR